MANYTKYTHRLGKALSANKNRQWLVELALDATPTHAIPMDVLRPGFQDLPMHRALASPEENSFVARVGLELVTVLLAPLLMLGSHMCVVTPGYVISFLGDFQTLFQSSRTILLNEKRYWFPHIITSLSFLFSHKMNVHLSFPGVLHVCNGWST